MMKAQKAGGLRRAIFPLLAVSMLAGIVGCPEGKDRAVKRDRKVDVGSVQADVASETRPVYIPTRKSERIQCELPAMRGVPTTIVKSVPNGSRVKEGDVLIEFEGFDYVRNYEQARLEIVDHEVALVTAENELNKAEIEYKSYREGEFLKEMLRIEGELEEAKERLEAAQLAQEIGKKENNGENAKAAELAVKAAMRQIEAVEQERKIYKVYSMQNQEAEYRVRISAAKAELSAATQKLELAKSRSAKMKKLVESCIVKSPKNGIVKFPSGKKVEPGMAFRRGQLVFYLEPVGQ